MPDVILTIFDGEKHFSYYRFQAGRFGHSREAVNENLVLHLNADQAVSNLRQDLAGIIRLKVAIGGESALYDLPKDWDLTIGEHKFEEIKLICHVFQAKNLSASDDNGTSDPLVQIYHLGSVSKSSVFPDTLNPNWNERIVMTTHVINGFLPPIVINVWDRDSKTFGDATHEFLGSAVVALSEEAFIANKEELSQAQAPQWHQLYFGNQAKMGKVLLSFAVLRKKHFHFIPSPRRIQPIRIKKSKHHLKINILGLRDLQSTGIMPIKSVEVQINTSSLKNLSQMQKGVAFGNLIASSKGGGANPTIGTVLSLSAMLPDDILHMPILSCQVLDSGFSFFRRKALIGTFAIDIPNHSYLSTIILLAKLEVLREFKQKQLEADSGGSSRDSQVQTLRDLDLIVGYLRKTQKQNELFIKINQKEVYDQGLATIRRLRESKHKHVMQRLTDIAEEKDVVPEDPEMKTSSALDQSLSFKTSERDHLLETMQENLETKEGKQMEPGVFLDGIQKIVQNKYEQIFKEEPVVILPQYARKRVDGKLTMVEKESPDPRLYLSLGYRSKKKDTKHYRKFIDRSLEASGMMGEDIFKTINIFRGKKINNEKKGLFARVFSSEAENYKQTGYFRGKIDVIEDDVLQRIIKLNIPRRELKLLNIPDSVQQWKHNNVD